MNEDLLLQELRALASKLTVHNIPLILGGGYGILLRANHIQRTGVRTRIEDIPPTRSTADLDIFIASEVIIDSNKTHLIREALDELGYVPVDTAKYYQFFREVNLSGTTRNTN